MEAHAREPIAERRRYDSPLRRQRTIATRERIVAAGSDLLHGFPIWNWSALTVRDVARRAGMSERTVYRHFASERALRDAVMQRLEEEAGVTLEGFRLEELADLTTRILAYVSSFPLAPRTPRDPTVAAGNQRQREALLTALGPATKGWPEVDRAIAGAVLDVLWAPVSYERLVTDWEISPEDAIRGITWVISLVEDALRSGHRPHTSDGSLGRPPGQK